jgi:hypothetical protein
MGVDHQATRVIRLSHHAVSTTRRKGFDIGQRSDPLSLPVFRAT